MSKTYRWHGEITRGAAPNTVVGELRDPVGYRIIITGIKTAHGYELIGIPGPIPDEYKLPGDDE